MLMWTAHIHQFALEGSAEPDNDDRLDRVALASVAQPSKQFDLAACAA